METNKLIILSFSIVVGPQQQLEAVAPSNVSRVVFFITVTPI